MPRESKQKRNLKQFSNQERLEVTSGIPNFIEVLKFVFAMIFCGFPEILSQEFSILLDNKTPSYYFIRKALDIIRPIIKQMAETSVADGRARIPQDGSVCVDGAWDHQRNGKSLIYDVICIQTKKIIDFELRIQISDKGKGNTIVSSQVLEGEVFERLYPRL